MSEARELAPVDENSGADRLSSAAAAANRRSTVEEGFGFDVERVRADFPVLHQEIFGKPLVYLDSANSSQKPRAVIDATSEFYSHDYSNIHRGLHTLSERATRFYNNVRGQVQRLLNARESREIIFTRGTTEGINLVAASFARPRFGPGDEILITAMEHHSNIVPWQMVCEQTGARLVVAPIDDRGDVIMEEYASLLSERTRLAAIVHISNVLGTVNPVGEMVRLAHEAGARVLLDGAQAVPHRPVDVQELGCDFYVFSGHKVYGPSGVGCLYGRAEILESMPPYMGGGDMIRHVSFEGTTYADLPERFEAGTPDIAGVVGLGAALDYVTGIGYGPIRAHEAELLEHANAVVESIPGIRLIGTARERSGLVNFVHEEIHAHDIGTMLDREGIAVRAGHHCAQPVMERFGVPATIRASFGLYNTRGELDRLGAALHKVIELLG